jgi:hypothetical protein
MAQAEREAGVRTGRRLARISHSLIGLRVPFGRDSVSVPVGGGEASAIAGALPRSPPRGQANSNKTKQKQINASKITYIWGGKGGRTGQIACRFWMNKVASQFEPLCFAQGIMRVYGTEKRSMWRRVRAESWRDC